MPAASSAIARVMHDRCAPCPGYLVALCMSITQMLGSE